MPPQKKIHNDPYRPLLHRLLEFKLCLGPRLKSSEPRVQVHGLGLGLRVFRVWGLKGAVLKVVMM